jgi:U3 small nucleolar RNA-associated protein 12
MISARLTYDGGHFSGRYGHKLPALSVSASSDGSLLVSGSADKSIKVWGLDFGDCHKSLHGHGEAVMCVAFVRETHFFFSASKVRNTTCNHHV